MELDTVLNTLSYRAAMLWFRRKYLKHAVIQHGTLGRTASAIGIKKRSLIRLLVNVGYTYTSGNVR